MRGAAIDDEKDRALRAGNEALQKRDEDGGVDATAFLDHEPHVATRRDRRNQAHAMPGASGLDDGRFAAFAPCAPGVVIGTDVRGVAEINVSSLFLRKFLDFWIFFLEPLLDQCLVALDCTVQWCLGR